MNNAVLISIRPEWCRLIAEGKKTIEVRKSYPKLTAPHKVYIYETRGTERVGNEHFNLVICGSGCGAVIGEFVCDGIYYVLDHPEVFAHHPRYYQKTLEAACMTAEQAIDYSQGKDLWGWHITGLRIYDKPKSITDFQRPCGNELYCESCAMYRARENACGNTALVIRRAPRSWCYVWELGSPAGVRTGRRE